MGGRDILIEKIKEFFKALFREGDKSNRNKYIIIIGCIGLLFIIVSNFFSSPDKVEEQPQFTTERETNAQESVGEDSALIVSVSEVEKQYEEDIQKMLNNIQGVSDAEVMVNLSSTNVKVYEKNVIVGKQTTEETDKNGGERYIEDETQETEVVFVRQGDREVPLLVQTRKPDVKGVLIIARGADNVEIKKWIVESVSKVLDVPTHRISVMPKVKGEN